MGGVGRPAAILLLLHVTTITDEPRCYISALRAATSEFDPSLSCTTPFRSNQRPRATFNGAQMPPPSCSHKPTEPPPNKKIGGGEQREALSLPSGRAAAPLAVPASGWGGKVLWCLAASFGLSCSYKEGPGRTACTLSLLSIFQACPCRVEHAEVFLFVLTKTRTTHGTLSPLHSQKKKVWVPLSQFSFHSVSVRRQMKHWRSGAGSRLEG